MMVQINIKIIKIVKITMMIGMIYIITKTVQLRKNHQLLQINHVVKMWVKKRPGWYILREK